MTHQENQKMENDMTLYFWHPVGSHVGESLREIIDRKQNEIQKHGFTLWSFSSAKLERITKWREEIKTANQNDCIIIGTGKKTKDPGQNKSIYWASEYSSDENIWLPIPKNMCSYHRPKNNKGIMASAFFVTKIEAPTSLKVIKPKTWLQTTKNIWETSQALPSRGQYLIKNPDLNSNTGMPIHVLLHAKPPFVVFIR